MTTTAPVPRGQADARSWRVALIPDAVLNPPPGSPSPSVPMAALDEVGYGVLQLPPADAGAEAGPLLAVIADQVAEYAHRGYAVVAIGWRGLPGDGLHWRRLAPLLRRLGTPIPPRHTFNPTASPDDERARLTLFLAGYDVSEEERQRWRP